MAHRVPSINAMVDSITDAVESAIRRCRAAGGLHRYMLQGVVRRVLKDINGNRIPSHRSLGLRADSQGGRRSSSRHLQHATGACPNHGSAMFVRCSTVALAPTPLPPPMPPLHWIGGETTPAARRGASFLNERTAGDAWPSEFAYDFDVALPPPPPLPTGRTYTDVMANPPRHTILSPDHALGAGFVSSSHEGEAIPRP
ncbi:hypothetical protein C2845_PM05G03300 [Panicum miliaceum]|uniref:Uncharacterized protein n=1 Tax=Panicum miliaceum TaxID=4540 RepID=A0A3L6T0I9_PANMI|nr:hypothetical protein C2845_PM05G03300 [Panicum miliaceum]